MLSFASRTSPESWSRTSRPKSARESKLHLARFLLGAAAEARSPPVPRTPASAEPARAQEIPRDVGRLTVIDVHRRVHRLHRFVGQLRADGVERGRELGPRARE